MKFVLEYDYRSDSGAQMVGPFDSREDADAHADTHLGDGWRAEYMIVPLTSPDADA